MLKISKKIIVLQKINRKYILKCFFEQKNNDKQNYCTFIYTNWENILLTVMVQ